LAGVAGECGRVQSLVACRRGSAEECKILSHVVVVVVYHISEEGLDFIRVFSGSTATSSASLLTVAAAESATAAGRRRRRSIIIIIMAGAQDSTNNTGVHNEEEKKPLDGGGGAHINLKVKGQVRCKRVGL